jgi:hypothetical protein
MTVTAATVVPMCVTSCQAGTSSAGDSGQVAQGVARTGFDGNFQGVAQSAFDGNGPTVAAVGFDGALSVANVGFDSSTGNPDDASADADEGG